MFTSRVLSGLEGPVPARCWVLLAPIATLFVFGVVRLHYNLPVFRVWILEDGLVEWVTFGGLLGMAALALGRAGSLAGHPGRSAWLLLGAALLFGAIEEISWGQRIFGWHSPEWFVRHNAQQETNIHNLVVAGVKVNRLVFGKLLGAATAFYLLLLPVLYRRRERVRDFMDRRALPVARRYQVLLGLAAWIVAELGRSRFGKSGELQELGVVFALAAVMLHPLNAPAHALGGLDAAFVRFTERLRAVAWSWLPARVRYLALATLVLVAQFTLFRLLFAAAFEPQGLVGPVGDVIWDRGLPSLQAARPGLAPADDVAHAWQLGLRFDLRIALLVLLPLALLGWMRRLDPARSTAARRGWLAYLALAATGVLAAHVLDLGHYAYESERLNAGVLDHVRETGTAMAMAWQTYPVPWILAALGLLAAANACFHQRWLPAAPDAPAGAAWSRRTAVTGATLLYVLGIHGQWSQYPLRWSDAYFSPNAYVSALASNPVQTLFDSARSPLAVPDADAACTAQALLAPHFDLPPCASPPASFTRYVQPAPPAGAPPNVVIVLLESFSAHKTGVMGNPLDPTPHFDALAQSSVLFTRFYSATRPTARSIFSVLFGIADVSPGRSASRNLRTVRQHTLINAFAGYRKHYFIGGSASWGNIRGMLLHNVPDLRLHEGESDLPGNDVWGASDLHLLEHAHEVLAAEQPPFLAFIQTAGNHRPYTIPGDARGFKRRPAPPAALAAAGFDEPDAYDGMRFMDHAIGRYLELARAGPYYADTIFAFFGDHGSPARRFPPHEQELRRLHVPLVLHAPGRLGARVIDTPVSSLDVLPTLAVLAGQPHLNAALGRNLLAARPADAQFALLAYGGFRGLVDAGHFYARDAAGRETLRGLRADGSLTVDDLGPGDPERLRRMAQLAGALHDGSGWLLEHNPPGTGATGR